MKFKHSFHVFVDNFAVTYKQLLYRLVILLITIGLNFAIVYPLIKGFTASVEYSSLMDGIKAFLKNLVEGHPDQMGAAYEQIKQSFKDLLDYISRNSGSIILASLGVVAVHLIGKFFTSLGNYAMAAVINDKMALRANSAFLITLVKNLKEACLYSLIYVPLSFIYDVLIAGLLFLIVFKALFFLPVLLNIFLFVTLCVLAISFKMVFTTDWLPALIRSKKKQGAAFLYTFNRRGKNTLNVLSNFIVIVLIIFAVNVFAVLFTFGAGALITVPSSYAILVCFEFVNYYDREELKYFIDKNTIIKPEKEHTPTIEEFFKGE